jgi:heme exporter protein A
MDMQVSNLAVARGGVAVLDGVTFRLLPGRVLVLRGPNGIGKTTLLRSLAGLQPALAGEVTVAAEAVAYAAHADGVKSVLTVAENLRFWAAAYGTHSVAQAFAEMNLEALANRRAAHLSAGQKRRLGLARLLVTGRPIWLMDEPTVSLDAASVALFAGVVARHLASGGSALIASHIDLGLEAEVLDLTPFKARSPAAGGRLGAFDEAFE